MEIKKKTKIDWTNKNILVVDDFSEFRHTVKKMLHSLNVGAVDEAGDAEKAIKKIETNSYDIILCDYNLGSGQKDGQQILEELKCRGLIKYSTIFMMLTAEKRDDMVMGAIEYRPDDYLAKPFNKNIFCSRLEKVVEKKKDIGKIEKAYLRKEFGRALEMIDKKIEENPKNIFELLRLKGDICLNRGEYDAAREVYKQALSMQYLPWAMLGLGVVCYYKEEYLDARDIFEEVIDENKMIMEAYDWLAKTFTKLNDKEEAELTLIDAVQHSPRSIQRQKYLGELAYENNNLELAEKSFRCTVDLGKTSVFKSTDDYTCLARVLIEKESADKALDVIQELRTEFEESQALKVQTAVMEGLAYDSLNQKEEADKRLKEAYDLYETMPAKLSVDTMIDMAKACLSIAEKEKGKQLLLEIVKNHHYDNKIIKKVQAVFDGANMHKEGEKIIKSAIKEIYMINNRGVKLVKEGELQKAINYLEQAAEALPDNIIINANAAQASIMYIQRKGKCEHNLYRCRKYLDRIERVDPTYKKFRELRRVYESYR